MYARGGEIPGYFMTYILYVVDKKQRKYKSSYLILSWSIFGRIIDM